MSLVNGRLGNDHFAFTRSGCNFGGGCSGWPLASHGSKGRFRNSASCSEDTRFQSLPHRVLRSEAAEVFRLGRLFFDGSWIVGRV